MNTPDPRTRDLAPDYPGMDDLLVGLVLPAGASMQVMSALETSRDECGRPPAAGHRARLRSVARLAAARHLPRAN